MSNKSEPLNETRKSFFYPLWSIREDDRPVRAGLRRVGFSITRGCQMGRMAEKYDEEGFDDYAYERFIEGQEKKHEFAAIVVMTCIALSGIIILSAWILEVLK